MNWQKILNPKAHDLTTNERRLRQTAVAAALFAALGVLVYTSVRLSEPVAVSKPSPAFTEDFTLRADSFDREVFVAKYDRRLKDLEARWAAFEDGQEKLMAAVDTLARRTEEAQAATVVAGGKPVETTTTKPAPSDAERRLAGDLQPALPPAPYAPYPPPGSEDAAAAFRSGADAWAAEAFGRPAPAAAPTLSVVTFTKKTPTSETRTPTVADAVLENRPVLNPDDPIAANRALGATAREYVTAGSIVRGTLLTGVYAPTGGAGAGTPVPILIDVAREALLPNGYRADLTDCRMTGNATGDLSSERILVRLERLACVGEKGEALDIRIRGYVAGPDGKVGLRGNLVTRSGQAIARALSVGILSGLGKAVALGASETTTYASGSQSTVYQNSLKAGLGEGTSNALDRIADYYLKVAEKIFPVLEVDGGQPVDVILLQGVLLETPKSGA